MTRIRAIAQAISETVYVWFYVVVSGVLLIVIPATNAARLSNKDDPAFWWMSLIILHVVVFLPGFLALRAVVPKEDDRDYLWELFALACIAVPIAFDLWMMYIHISGIVEALTT